VLGDVVYTPGFEGVTLCYGVVRALSFSTLTPYTFTKSSCLHALHTSCSLAIHDTSLGTQTSYAPRPPFNASCEARRQLLLPLVFLEGAAASLLPTSPRRRRTIGIPPHIRTPLFPPNTLQGTFPALGPPTQRRLPRNPSPPASNLSSPPPSSLILCFSRTRVPREKGVP